MGPPASKEVTHNNPEEEKKVAIDASKVDIDGTAADLLDEENQR